MEEPVKKVKKIKKIKKIKKVVKKQVANKQPAQDAASIEDAIALELGSTTNQYSEENRSATVLDELDFDIDIDAMIEEREARKKEKKKEEIKEESPAENEIIIDDDFFKDEPIKIPDSVDDDFDKMLDDFIQNEIEDLDDKITYEAKQEEEERNNPIVNVDIGSIGEENRQIVKLQTNEKALYLAYKNLSETVNAISQELEIQTKDFLLTPDMLLPYYKPSVGSLINVELSEAWDILIAKFPKELLGIDHRATDEELLNIAEATREENLQQSLVSHVEVMIELEACEINYEERRIKRERKKIERKILRERKERQETMRFFIEEIKKKEFPIDAEKLVKNFFNAYKKDPDNSPKILYESPATYAPIDFDKIKSKFFGMIKPKPEDGIKINKRIGSFLRKLKKLK